MAVEETEAGASAPAVIDCETTRTTATPPPPPQARAQSRPIPGSRVAAAGPPPCSPTARVADEQELRAWIDSGSKELTPGVWGVLAETAASGFVR